MSAYDKLYLAEARVKLGNMLDCAVNRLHCPLRDFWNMFLDSVISTKFQFGDSTTIAGKSGIEICFEVMNKEPEILEAVVSFGKSPEYWAGWALAYYQWETDITFAQIDKIVPIENIIGMYFPYHEMDIRHFRDRMNELMNISN